MEWFSLKSISQQTTKEPFTEEYEVKIKTQGIAFTGGAPLVTCYVRGLPSLNQGLVLFKMGQMKMLNDS